VRSSDIFYRRGFTRPGADTRNRECTCNCGRRNCQGRRGGWVYDNDGRRIRQFPGDGGADHQANFIKAVRSRKPSDLRADILEGHISATLCHMANISYRLAHEMPPQSIKKVVSDNEVLGESFDRILSHIRANEIDLDMNPLSVGPALEFDKEQEQFMGEHGEWANMFLKRIYRPPFVVPEFV
jgi:hypothetical protein